MAPDWLENLAKAYLATGFLCAVVIAVDLLRRPQKMWIMNVVWPVTALYFGPLALWSYWVVGRARGGHGDGKPFWQQTAAGVTHCGAGCTLGGIAGEWLVFGVGWTLFGVALYPDYIVDFGFAYVLGIVFQYFAIPPMRGLRLSDGIVAAVKADTISLVAFEIGLFAVDGAVPFRSFPRAGCGELELLVHDGDWHDYRLFYQLSGKLVTDPQRPQGADVTVGGRASVIASQLLG